MILRAEGLALFIIATLGFAWTDRSWWLYGLLFLVPDVAFAAYLAGPRTGALIYNALHTTLAPAALALAGALMRDLSLIACGAIWAAHIGADRALGYGLKYRTGFGDTHLGRVGRRPAATGAG